MFTRSRIKALIFIIFAVFAIWWFGRPLLEVYKRTDRIDSLKTEVEELEQKKAELEKQVSYYRTDSYVEKEARDKLNMVREEEKVLIIGENTEEDEDEKGEAYEVETKPPYEQWKDLFFE